MADPKLYPIDQRYAPKSPGHADYNRKSGHVFLCDGQHGPCKLLDGWECMPVEEAKKIPKAE
jgi:hypothetical protein